MNQKRIEQIRERMLEKKAHAFFITNHANIFFTTGFRGVSKIEREATVLITHDSVYLFLPKMYEAQGKQLDSVQKKLVTCIVDHKQYNLLTSFSQFVHTADTTLVEKHDLRLSEYMYIEKQASSTLSAVSNVIEELRIVKDPEEINHLKDVINSTDQVFDALVQTLSRVDYTELVELDIVDMMRQFGREFGVNAFSFDPIVAVGANAAEPHYHTGSAPLKKQHCLLLDFGFEKNGYISDMTRTLFLGNAPASFTQIYELVKQNNEACIKLCAPGVSTKEMFHQSVELFKKEKKDQYYLHSLGHGIGIDVHEAPSLSKTKDTILKQGMAITIEPGLYLHNEFGVRIEDDVLITEEGYTVLTNSPKELIEIP